MKKKIFAFALVFILLLSLLSACGGSGKKDTNTLTVWCWDPNFNIYAMQEAEKVYQKTHPDFKLEIVDMTSNDIETALNTAALSKDMSTLPDIFLAQNNSFQKLVLTIPEVFTELTNSGIKFSDFAATGASTVDGKNYGVPFDNSTCIFGLRIDILAEAGYTIEDFTDITWDDFIAKATVVKEKTGKALLSGDAGATDMILVMLQSAGISLFDNSGQPFIANNSSLKTVIELYANLVKSGLFVQVNSWDEYIGSFVNGDVGGVIIGCWGIGSIRSDSAAYGSGVWQITNLPKLNVAGATNYSAWGGSSWAVSSNANTELAIDFLLATFAGSTELYDTILPTAGAIANWKPASASTAYQEKQPFFNDQAVFEDIVTYSGQVPSVSTGIYFYEARDAVSVAIQNYMAGADLAAELQAAEETVLFKMG